MKRSKRSCACFVKKTAKPGRPKASALCKNCGCAAASHGKRRKAKKKTRKGRRKARRGVRKGTKISAAFRSSIRRNPLVLDPGGVSYTGPYGPFGYLNKTRYPFSGRVNPPSRPQRPAAPTIPTLTHDQRFDAFRAMLNQYDKSPAWGPGLGNNPYLSANPYKKKNKKRKARRKGRKGRGKK